MELSGKRNNYKTVLFLTHMFPIF